MRRLATTLCASIALFALLAPAALGAGSDHGEGLWGETTDRVVTNAGFILIAFFPLFVLVMSLLQGRLERRKDMRKAAAKAHAARLRGGW